MRCALMVSQTPGCSFSVKSVASCLVTFAWYPFVRATPAYALSWLLPGNSVCREVGSCAMAPMCHHMHATPSPHSTCTPCAAAVLGCAPHMNPPHPPQGASLWKQQTGSLERLLCLTTTGQALLRLLLRWMPASEHQGAVVSRPCGQDSPEAGCLYTCLDQLQAYLALLLHLL
jgi:hypothetical protein